MRGLLFSLFKIFKRIENFFYKRIRVFLRRGKVDQDKICRTNVFYRKIGILRNNLFNWTYEKLRPKGVVLINIQENKMYVNTDDRGIAPMLLVDGAMEKYETELCKNMLKEDMVVVDIGANIGYYSLIAAKLVSKNGIVYAFEPEPTTYELLCKNIELNGYTNVVPIRKAIANRCSKAKFWVDKTGIAISSFSKDNVLTFEKDKSSENLVCYEVETITLDKFFESTVGNTKVDFIKIDTQGAEGLVIEGGREVLKDNDNMKITMEFWPDGLRRLGTDPLELLTTLRKCGFKIELINEKEQVLKSVKPDFFREAEPNQEFNLFLMK